MLLGAEVKSRNKGGFQRSADFPRQRDYQDWNKGKLHSNMSSITCVENKFDKTKAQDSKRKRKR